jgi:hypothetical protein
MTGFSDFSSRNALNYITGVKASPSLPSVFLALFTAAGTDAGTGFTEVSGGSYARVQVSGALTASGSFTTASTSITLNSTAPAWLLALGTNGSGVNVYDATAGAQIGTVSSVSGTTVTLTSASSTNSSGSTDSLVFSAFSPASGTAPASITNNATITFPAATGSWGTVTAFGLYDASSSGNLMIWDYMGNFSWLPATVSSASPGVITAKAHGYSNGDSFVFSTEYGGITPSFSAGNYNGTQTVAGASTDTFNVTGVNTSTTGSGNVRKVASQSVPSGVTAFFAASSLAATAA